MKRLIIRNFGPIEDVAIELSRINIIIGPQSSGKSTVLKVACFCDWIERQITMTQNPDKYCQASFFVQNLIGFHKLEGFMHKNTYIRYDNEAISFEFDAKTNVCQYSLTTNAERWAYKRPKIAYIPAERNLVAAIPNWFQVSMSNNNILDFMKEWEFARKSCMKKVPIFRLPFSYRYNRADNADRIVMPNGKELNLTNASSGLQSLTPLYVVLRYLTNDFFKERHTTVEDVVLRDNLKKIVALKCADKKPEEQQSIVDNILIPYRLDLFIEEPEAHIFPSTQKSFVYELISMLNDARKHSCFIATHSPYIMTALNNLILADERMAESRETARLVKACFAKRQTLPYTDVSAYAMKDGKITSIMDEEFHLISADALDYASQEIADDFNFLLSL